MDPLLIDTMDIVQSGGGPVTMVVNFRNLHLHGLADAHIDSVSGFGEDFNGKIMEIKGVVPSGQLLGDYKIVGRLLLLPIRGEGKANVTLDRTGTVIRFKAKEVIKNEKRYLYADKVKMRIEPTR